MNIHLPHVLVRKLLIPGSLCIVHSCLTPDLQWRLGKETSIVAFFKYRKLFLAAIDTVMAVVFDSKII